MLFNKCIELCKHYYSPVLGHCHHSNIHLLFVFVDFTFLDISYKCNNKINILLYWASLIA